MQDETIQNTVSVETADQQEYNDEEYMETEWQKINHNILETAEETLGKV